MAHVHIVPHLIPRHRKARAVAAEDRVRRVIRQGIICGSFHDSSLVAGGRVAAHPYAKGAATVRQREEFLLPGGEDRVGSLATEDDRVVLVFG